MEQSTIRLSKETKDRLAKKKNHPGETYEQVIDRLLRLTEQDDVLSDEAIRDIEEGIADIRAGRTHTSEQIREKLGLE